MHNLYKMLFIIRPQEVTESYLVSSKPTKEPIRPGEIHFSCLGLLQEQAVKLCTEQVMSFQPTPLRRICTSDYHLEVPQC